MPPEPPTPAALPASALATTTATPFHTRGRPAVIALGYSMGVEAARLLVYVGWAGMLYRVRGGGHAPEGYWNAINALLEVLRWFSRLAFGSCIVLFLRWFMGAHRNLPLLGAREMAYSPGWAMASFFVPLANAVLPWRVASEVWRASDPAVLGPVEWKGAPGSWTVRAWWAAWLAMMMVSSSFGRVRLTPESTVQEEIPYVWRLAALSAAMMVAAALAIRMIRATDARQHAKHERWRNAPVILAETGEVVGPRE